MKCQIQIPLLVLEDSPPNDPFPHITFYHFANSNKLAIRCSKNIYGKKRERGTGIWMCFLEAKGTYSPFHKILFPSLTSVSIRILSLLAQSFRYQLLWEHKSSWRASINKAIYSSVLSNEEILDPEKEWVVDMWKLKAIQKVILWER